MKKPYQKAKELMDKYNAEIYKFSSTIGFSSCAKECALIAVEEVIQTLHSVDKGYNMVENIEHWNAVKTEINNL